jgi:hypothetical protein
MNSATARDRLLALVKAGKPFTSHRRLGNLIGCPSRRVMLAIAECDELQVWERTEPLPPKPVMVVTVKVKTKPRRRANTIEIERDPVPEPTVAPDVAERVAIERGTPDERAALYAAAREWERRRRRVGDGDD